MGPPPQLARLRRAVTSNLIACGSLSSDPALSKALASLATSGDGVQVAAYKGGELVVDAWAGTADLGSPVMPDTMFQLFGIAKVVTALALHVQAERGLIDYDTPISSYWPEFGAHGKARATVRDALSHRLGIPQMPEGITPRTIGDWDRVAAAIAELKPIFEPGTNSAYLAMTFGWVIGELVKRTDPLGRPLEQFIDEEICVPLAIDSLRLTVNAADLPRVARLLAEEGSVLPEAPPGTPPTLRQRSMPHELALSPEVCNHPDTLAACSPATNAVGSARALARLFGLIAGGGAINGVRLLSQERTQALATPRARPDEIDLAHETPVPLSAGGLWVTEGSADPSVHSSPRSVYHPSRGGVAVAWADLDANVAVAICRRRMVTPSQLVSRDLNPLVPVADAIRDLLV